MTSRTHEAARLRMTPTTQMPSDGVQEAEKTLAQRTREYEALRSRMFATTSMRDEVLAARLAMMEAGARWVERRHRAGLVRDGLPWGRE